MNFIRKLNNNKILLWVILSVFLICSVLYYFNSYFVDSEIVFTKSDSFILTILGTSILTISILVIYLVFKVRSLNNTINETRILILSLQEDLENIEDGNVNLHRTTQLMIMNLSKKLGVGINEEER